MTREKFQTCVDACLACAHACEYACIGHADMAGCVRTCRDCAELCWTCAGYMSRGS